jgi:hypothetical protein
MSQTTITYLNVLSATDTSYSYGNLPPVITVGSSIPSTKYSNTNITQYFTITDDVGILPSGLVLSAGSPVSTSAITVVDDKTLLLDLTVNASGSIGISATDIGGLTSTEIVTNYIIDTSVTGPPPPNPSVPIVDLYAPGIKYTLHNPSDRFVLTTDGNNTGSVHVTVTDDIEIVYDNFYPSKYIGLVPGSVGEIDATSWVQTTSAIVEFDVINISATGDVIVSATDFWGGNNNSESDTKWMVGCATNDRLINLVDFLPQHLYNSETYDFTKMFENFLNTLYENKDDPCNIGILKKIEQIGDLHDPQLMDTEYLQFYADFLGYNLTPNRGEIGNITNGVSSNGTYIDDEESKKYLRFVVENLPNWYKIKSTRNAIRIMLFSFGVVGDLYSLFTDDYNKNWQIHNETAGQSILGQGIPSGWYPTPHFSLQVDLRKTPAAWINNQEQIINAIDSVRPINTVFEGFRGYFEVSNSSPLDEFGNPTDVDENGNPLITNGIRVTPSRPVVSTSVFIDWPNNTATCATDYTNMYSDGSDGNLSY